MANWITSIRIAFLLVLVVLVLNAPPVVQWINAPLLVLVIVLDGVDGWVARGRGEASSFGSVYDIMADRLTENVLWITLVAVDLVGVWVAIVFITRSIVVDTIRYTSFPDRRGGNVLDLMLSWWGRWLVRSRSMRATYGTAKALTFGWLLAIQPMALGGQCPEFWSRWGESLANVGQVLVVVTVVLCLARGTPVVVVPENSVRIVGKGLAPVGVEASCSALAPCKSPGGQPFHRRMSFSVGKASGGFPDITERLVGG